MVYEIPAGHMMTITGPCRAEVVGTEEVFTLSEVPPMILPTPVEEPAVHPVIPEPKR